MVGTDHASIITMPFARAFAVVAAVLIIGAHETIPASAEDWPTHSLTLVVPWAAGGGTDGGVA